MKIPDVTKMYQDAAKGLSGDLKCARCGRIDPCPPSSAAYYLAHGWPKCCQQTMELVKPSAARGQGGDKP